MVGYLLLVAFIAALAALKLSCDRRHQEMHANICSRATEPGENHYC